MVKKRNNIKSNVRKKRKILFASVTFLVVITIGLIGFRFVEQQRDLSQLSEVSKDLKAVYDKLLGLNDGNVASASFDSVCFESSVELGKGQVSCGPNARIVLKIGVNADSAQKSMQHSLDSVSLSGRSGATESASSQNETYIKYAYLDISVRCLVNHATATTYYMTCSKDVPDFLPGYTVEK